MNKKTVFILKSNLNVDGRVINEIRILQDKFPDLKIDIVLMPDKPFHLDLGKNVTVHIVNSLVRNSRYLKFLTVLDITLRAFFKLLKLKPNILHVQDSSIVFPALLFIFFKRRKTVIIYDDHEFPNENERLFVRIINSFEYRLIKKADILITANQERLDLINQKFKLSCKTSYFLNLPYFQENKNLNYPTSEKNKSIFAEIDKELANGTKFIVHQGLTQEERGRKKLAQFSKILPKNYKIYILGEKEANFNAFINEYELNRNHFFFVGIVDYTILPEFWRRSKALASVIMYLPTYTNNRLCAPNRFYYSIEQQIPVIVNKDNPVLFNFVETYHCGFYIENFDNAFFKNLETFDSAKLKSVFDDLRNEQIDNFENLYTFALNHSKIIKPN